MHYSAHACLYNFLCGLESRINVFDYLFYQNTLPFGHFSNTLKYVSVVMMINDTEEQAGAEAVPSPPKIQLKIDFENFLKIQEF